MEPQEDTKVTRKILQYLENWKDPEDDWEDPGAHWALRIF